ncbi:MAG TPA: hypothetical protein VIT42_06305 [Microlunatus sp.]
MALGYQIAVFIHLVAFAALLGGCLAQLRAGPPPEVNLAMLYGAWVQLISGLGLVILRYLQLAPLNYLSYAIKLLLTLLVLVLVAKNRKFQSVPGGLLIIIIGLTLVSAGLATFWS